MTAGRRRWPIITVTLVVVVGVIAVVGWYAWVPTWRPARGPGERWGVDVSRHQGEIDWRSVAADDIDFAYIKATEGQDFTDVRFRENWEGAGRAGLDRGAYHYFTLCSDGVRQAEHFLAIAAPDPDDLPPVVDLEDLTGSCNPTLQEVGREVMRFVDTVEAAVDRRIVLYVGADFEAKFGISEVLTRYLWDRSLFRRPSVEGWLIWQAHYRAAVDGIDGGVDLDLMRATGEESGE